MQCMRRIGGDAVTPPGRAGAPARIGRRAVLTSFAGLALSPGWARAAAEAPHAGHRVGNAGGSRTLVQYTVPDLQLVRDDGRRVSLVDEINDGRPVVLAFVYTSCTTVCPVISQTLAQLQELLGPLRDTVHLMSISIDPEHDTPARLREYGRKFGAGPSWQHYTGPVAASVAAQRAFNVYRGDKMEHAPATLVRAKPAAPWARLEGFASARQLLAELPDFCVARPGAG